MWVRTITLCVLVLSGCALAESADVVPRDAAGVGDDLGDDAHPDAVESDTPDTAGDAPDTTDEPDSSADAPDAQADTPDALADTTDAPDTPDVPETECPCPETHECVDDICRGLWEDLIPLAPGFAGGTLGGARGELCTVSTTAPAGPGSFGECLLTPRPVWVVFDPDLDGPVDAGVVTLGSDITIDGRGPSVVTLEGQLGVIAGQNVIVHNVRIDAGEGRAVDVVDSRWVWIDRVTLRDFDRGLRVSQGSTNVGLTHLNLVRGDLALEVEGLTVDDTQVTIDHVYIDGVPRILTTSRAFVHLANGRLDNWTEGTPPLVVDSGGHVLLEGLMFGFNGPILDVSTGAVRGNHLFFDPDASYADVDPESVPDPGYVSPVCRSQADCNAAGDATGARPSPLPGRD